MSESIKLKIVDSILKNIFDIIFSVIGLTILSPIFLLIAFFIKLDSPGPIFFKAERAGIDNSKFFILKFRTMVVGAERGPGTTSRNDSRITRVGRFIRKFKLDEIPQLINILRGEMSFVGPRPELIKYTSLYDGEEKIILSVKPGITDFSSIYFSDLNTLIDDNNPDLSFEMNVLEIKNRLRVKYVRERSFLVDMWLILKTIFVIFRKI